MHFLSALLAAQAVAADDRRTSTPAQQGEGEGAGTALGEGDGASDSEHTYEPVFAPSPDTGFDMRIGSLLWWRERQSEAKRKRLVAYMNAVGLPDDGFYAHNDVLRARQRPPASSTNSPRPMTGDAGASRAAKQPAAKPPHPLAGVRTEPVVKGPGKRTRAQRRADAQKRATQHGDKGRKP